MHSCLGAPSVKCDNHLDAERSGRKKITKPTPNSAPSHSQVTIWTALLRGLGHAGASRTSAPSSASYISRWTKISVLLRGLCEHSVPEAASLPWFNVPQCSQVPTPDSEARSRTQSTPDGIHSPPSGPDSASPPKVLGLVLPPAASPEWDILLSHNSRLRVVGRIGDWPLHPSTSRLDPRSPLITAQTAVLTEALPRLVCVPPPWLECCERRMAVNNFFYLLIVSLFCRGHGSILGHLPKYNGGPGLGFDVHQSSDCYKQ